MFEEGTTRGAGFTKVFVAKNYFKTENIAVIWKTEFYKIEEFGNTDKIVIVNFYGNLMWKFGITIMLNFITLKPVINAVHTSEHSFFLWNARVF